MKSRWCVFSHISLFPNAVMLHSFGITLILFQKIPLIFDAACNTKKMKMLSSVKNTDAIFYVLTLRYPGPSAEHASLFPCLMHHIQSELMKPPTWNECYWRCLEDGLSKKSNQMEGQPFCPCHIDYLSIWPSALTHACF